MENKYRIEVKKKELNKKNPLIEFKCDICGWRNARSCSGGKCYCVKCWDKYTEDDI